MRSNLVFINLTRFLTLKGAVFGEDADMAIMQCSSANKRITQELGNKIEGQLFQEGPGGHVLLIQVFPVLVGGAEGAGVQGCVREHKVCEGLTAAVGDLTGKRERSLPGEGPRGLSL